MCPALGRLQDDTPPGVEACCRGFPYPRNRVGRKPPTPQGVAESSPPLTPMNRGFRNPRWGYRRSVGPPTVGKELHGNTPDPLRGTRPADDEGGTASGLGAELLRSASRNHPLGGRGGAVAPLRRPGRFTAAQTQYRTRDRDIPRGKHSSSYPRPRNRPDVANRLSCPNIPGYPPP